MSTRPTVLGLLAAAALIAGCGSSAGSSSSTSTASTTSQSSTSASSSTEAGAGQIGFEGVVIEPGELLASPSTTGTRTADGLKCAPTEQLVYHIHAHLTVYVNGQPRALPGGIGIPGSQEQVTSEGPVAVGGRCIYWLHTHAPDGIIHVESPARRIYTLGNFFAEWRQPLSAGEVAGAKGQVTAVVNGARWTKSPRAIPLLPHADIQLSVGQPLPPFHSMSWSGLQL